MSDLVPVTCGEHLQAATSELAAGQAAVTAGAVALKGLDLSPTQLRSSAFQLLTLAPNACAAAYHYANAYLHAIMALTVGTRTEP